MRKPGGWEPKLYTTPTTVPRGPEYSSVVYKREKVQWLDSGYFGEVDPRWDWWIIGRWGLKYAEEFKVVSKSWFVR